MSFAINKKSSKSMQNGTTQIYIFEKPVAKLFKRFRSMIDIEISKKKLIKIL